MHGIVHVAYACGLVLIVQNFGMKFFLRREECKTRKKSNFLKNGNFGKNSNFSRFRKTKRTSPLELSREI